MPELVCGFLQVTAGPHVAIEYTEVLAVLESNAVELGNQLTALVEEVPNATQPDNATQTLLPCLRGFLFAFNVVNRLGVVAEHVDDRFQDIKMAARAFRLAILARPAVFVDEGWKDSVAMKIRTVFQSEVGNPVGAGHALGLEPVRRLNVLNPHRCDGGLVEPRTAQVGNVLRQQQRHDENLCWLEGCFVIRRRRLAYLWWIIHHAPYLERVSTILRRFFPEVEHAKIAKNVDRMLREHLSEVGALARRNDLDFTVLCLYVKKGRIELPALGDFYNLAIDEIAFLDRFPKRRLGLLAGALNAGLPFERSRVGFDF